MIFLVVCFRFPIATTKTVAPILVVVVVKGDFTTIDYKENIMESKKLFRQFINRAAATAVDFHINHHRISISMIVFVRFVALFGLAWMMADAQSYLSYVTSSKGNASQSVLYDCQSWTALAFFLIILIEALMLALVVLTEMKSPTQEFTSYAALMISGWAFAAVVYIVMFDYLSTIHAVNAMGVSFDFNVGWWTRRLLPFGLGVLMTLTVPNSRRVMQSNPAKFKTPTAEPFKLGLPGFDLTAIKAMIGIGGDKPVTPKPAIDWAGMWKKVMLLLGFGKKPALVVATPGGAQAKVETAAVNPDEQKGSQGGGNTGNGDKPWQKHNQHHNGGKPGNHHQHPKPNNS